MSDWAGGADNGGGGAVDTPAEAAAKALPKTAFGELLTAALTVHIQGGFEYNIHPQIWDTSGSINGGTVTQISDRMAEVSTSTNAAGNGLLFSRALAKYHHGQGLLARFTTIYTAGVADSTQTMGIMDDDDGLAFGYNGAAFGVVHRRGGSDTWVPQADWNRDRMDGTGASGMVLDPTLGNVYQVRLQWLGFGALSFYIEDPATGMFTLVHQVEYANANAIPSVQNPSFPVCVQAINTGNTSNLVIRTSSAMVATEGTVEHHGPRFDAEATKLAVGTTLTPILTLRNRAAFNGYTNKGIVLPVGVSFSVDGTKAAIVQVILNGTLTGAVYSDVDTLNSIGEKDTTATAINGTGIVVWSRTMSKLDADAISFKELGIQDKMPPGSWITLAVRATSGTTDVTVTGLWQEEH